MIILGVKNGRKDAQGAYKILVLKRKGKGPKNVNSPKKK
jgi:hypothetical protein